MKNSMVEKLGINYFLFVVLIINLIFTVKQIKNPFFYLYCYCYLFLLEDRF